MLIKVALTWFPDGGRGERTVWTQMPQVPGAGDSLSVGDDDIATMRVRHVLWCAGKDQAWHAEVTLGN